MCTFEGIFYVLGMEFCKVVDALLGGVGCWGQESDHQEQVDVGFGNSEHAVIACMIITFL